MSKSCDISVIICTYTEDRWDDLIAAVKSVQCQSIIPREIIVVVDHNFGLLERAKKYLLDVKIVENNEAPGLARARNSGLGVASGEIIAFLDDDAIAAQDWLELLKEGFTNPMVIGVGGFIRASMDRSLPQVVSRRILLDYRLFISRIA